MRAVLPLAAVVLVTAGCGSSSKDVLTTTGTTTTRSASTTSTTTSAAAPTVTRVTLYFLQGGELAAVQREIPATRAVGLAALGALAAGPVEGLATDLPAGTKFASLTVSGGTARVSVTPPLGAARPAIAQIVYTLTQFPSIERVVIGEGRTLTRRSDLPALPAILVDSPGYGDTVSSPLPISGTANTFEATYNYELAGGGKVLAKGFGTATSGSGTRGTFTKTIRFDVASPVPGKLVVYELSAADGSRIHAREIPLRLEP